MAISSKKGLAFGIIATVLLILGASLEFIPMAHTRMAVLTEKDAERISGNFFNMAIVSPATGYNSTQYGAKIVEYASYNSLGENYGAFIETVYMFNSTASASFAYQYFVRELTINNMSHVDNSDYRGFNYTYMVHMYQSTSWKSYSWGVSGFNGNYVFEITGYSQIKPRENVMSIAHDQINTMEVPGC